MTEAAKKEWFIGATEAAAKEAMKALRESHYHPHWLFFKPGEMSFYIVPEGHPVPEGYHNAADQSLPVTFTGLDQMTAWIRWKTQGLPHFPKADPSLIQ